MENNILVLDEFIDPAKHEEIQKHMEDVWFSWFRGAFDLSSSTNVIVDENTVTKFQQFSHQLFSERTVKSKSFQMAFPIFDRLVSMGFEGLTVVEANAVMTTPLPKAERTGTKYTPKHIDLVKDTGYCTAIYFVNESDGDVVFFGTGDDDLEIEVSRVSPKKGRVVIFDGCRFHASMFPQESDTRMVLNLNFKHDRSENEKNNTNNNLSS